MRSEKQVLHDKAMNTAQAMFYKNGHSIKVMAENNSKFDLLIDGKARIEVKAAAVLQKISAGGRAWRFNLHRHGVVPPDQADFYWIYLANVSGFKSGVSLMVPHAAVKGQTN